MNNAHPMIRARMCGDYAEHGPKEITVAVGFDSGKEVMKGIRL